MGDRDMMHRARQFVSRNRDFAAWVQIVLLVLILWRLW
jgi:hypothetical protein